MKKLKPGTSYDFNEADLQFVVELAKVGHVHLLSNQVSLITTREYDENASMEFKDIMSEEKCDGLRLPHNWCIEWIGSSKKGISITFGVKKVLSIILIALFASCAPSRYLECPRDVTVTGDTITEQMLVTVRPMGFAVARYGLAIVRDDTCRAHLFCDGRRIKAPVKVWDCETERKRRAR